jgi:hypothetical protein
MGFLSGVHRKTGNTRMIFCSGVSQFFLSLWFILIRAQLQKVIGSIRSFAVTEAELEDERI